MIKIENTEVLGWEHAIRGMRNPKNSWDKSDSEFCGKHECKDCEAKNTERCMPLEIGDNDLSLMKRLRDAGKDHRKYMRMIVVYVEVTAPLYWWKEADTYKVGTVRNSCSTMHRIHAKEFSIDDFSIDGNFPESEAQTIGEIVNNYLGLVEYLREQYNETKDKSYWRLLIQLLPSSYNQKATLMLNYEVLANMYHSRKNHKLDEWVEFCKWIETLPYSELITGEQNERE